MTIHDQWILAPLPDRDPDLPVSSRHLRAILFRRGVRNADEYRLWAHPTLEDLHDGSLIDGMEEACDRIERAIRDREQILIYGDYDVDGVTSIVLLKTVLTALGASVGYVVPHRLHDGYGLKTEVIDRVLIEREVRLIVTVDCGITSVEPVEHALDLGIDVIITDHHLPPESLPNAAAVLNPKKDGCVYPFKELAGVGVAFKLCCELLRRAGHSMSVASLAKVAAIGTIADVAPLVGENRTLARVGLLGLADSTNPGLRAMLRILNLLGKPLRAFDVGFKIGPRINAAGRIASADTAIELFESRNDESATKIVLELDRLNAQRKSVERQVIEEAQARIDPDRLPPVLFLCSEHWHKGVLGLCAGRIAESNNRPTLLGTVDDERIVGSGRSVGSVDLHGRLTLLRDLFLSFGGHAFACGFSFELRRLEEFERRLQEAFADVPEESLVRSVMIENTLELSHLNQRLAEELEMFEPLGEANPEPAFLVREARVRSVREFSPGCFSVLVEDGRGTAEGVLWPSRGSLRSIFQKDLVVDLVVTIEKSSFSANGARFIIVDGAPAGTVALRNETGEPNVLPGGSRD